MDVVRLLVRRGLLALPILFGVLLLTFLLIRMGNNDPVGLLAGPTPTDADIERIMAKLKLDLPLWRQFWEFIVLVAQGDLGYSWLSDRPVAGELVARLPATLELVLFGALLGGIIGIPSGLLAAFRPNRWFDQVSRVISLLGFGMPTLFLGLAAIFVFFFLLEWAPPPMGRLDLVLSPPATITGSYFLDGILHGNWEVAQSAGARLVLPICSVALVFAAPLVKQTRAIALDVLASDYVRFARAAGLPPAMVRRLVWRNSSVPIITYVGVELTALFGAAAVLELIFSWGGLSQFGLTARLRGDFAVVQGYVLFMSLIAMAIFAIADILVLAIEPRARTGQR